MERLIIHIAWFHYSNDNLKVLYLSIHRDFPFEALLK
jgi:hypothetical protein